MRKEILILLSLVLLVGTASAITPLIADFSVNPPLEVCINEPVYFTDESTSSGTIIAWKWDFGDTKDSGEQNPVHSYKNPGSYTVILRVDDDIPLVNTTTRIVNVSACGLGETVPWCEDVDMFFWNMSDDIPGYRVLNNIPEPSIQHTITTAAFDSTSGEVLLGTWITPYGVPDRKILAPGLWRFRTYMRASSDSGVTSIQFHAINRSADGTETDLFYGTAISEDIARGTVPSEYLLSYARRNTTTFFPGDRLVIRATASTDSTAARTVSMYVGGNTNASMVDVSYFICNNACTGACGGAKMLPIPIFIPILAAGAAFLFLRRQ